MTGEIQRSNSYVWEMIWLKKYKYIARKNYIRPKPKEIYMYFVINCD